MFFIVIVAVYLILTLKKPKNEDKALANCGIGQMDKNANDIGNIFNNIIELLKLSPLFLIAATSY